MTVNFSTAVLPPEAVATHARKHARRRSGGCAAAIVRYGLAEQADYPLVIRDLARKTNLPLSASL